MTILLVFLLVTISGYYANAQSQSIRLEIQPALNVPEGTQVTMTCIPSIPLGASAVYSFYLNGNQFYKGPEPEIQFVVQGAGSSSSSYYRCELSDNTTKINNLVSVSRKLSVRIGNCSENEVRTPCFERCTCEELKSGSGQCKVCLLLQSGVAAPCGCAEDYFMDILQQKCVKKSECLQGAEQRPRQSTPSGQQSTGTATASGLESTGTATASSLDATGAATASGVETTGTAAASGLEATGTATASGSEATAAIPATDNNATAQATATGTGSGSLTCSCASQMKGQTMSDQDRSAQKAAAAKFLGPIASFQSSSCMNGQSTCTAQAGSAGQVPFCMGYVGPNNPPKDNTTITWRDCIAIDTTKLPPNQCLNLASFGLPQAFRCTCNGTSNCNEQLQIPMGTHPEFTTTPMPTSIAGSGAGAGAAIGGLSSTAPTNGGIPELTPSGATGSGSGSGSQCPEPILQPAEGDCTWKVSYEMSAEGCTTRWEKQCPQQQCPPNEQYMECGTACEPTCANYQSPPPCMFVCRKGCFCTQGYVRDKDNGQCVPTNSCATPQCIRPNEHIDNCGGVCEPTCQTADTPQACPMICRNEKKCVCDQGFYRNLRGECVTRNQCRVGTLCDSNTEVYRICGSACERTCQNHRSSDSDICVAMCVDGCFCKDGYVRQTPDGICVEQSKCQQSADLGGACSQAPDPGPCRAAIQRYYFDASAGICRPFTFGGCYGNANRFTSIQECMGACGNVGSPFCPRGHNAVQCAVNPCNTNQCTNPDAVCVPVYCDSCQVRFYSKTSGFELSAAECGLPRLQG